MGSRIGSLVVALLMMAAIAVGCVPVPVGAPTQPAVVEVGAKPSTGVAVPTTVPAESWCRPLGEAEAVAVPGYRLLPGEFYVPNQVILTGNIDSVQSVLNSVKGLELKPLRSLDLSYLEPYRLKWEEQKSQQAMPGRYTLPFPDYKGLIVGLYEIGGGKPVPEAIAEITRAALEVKGAVFADPNYITGYPVTGSPWEVEGSPWEVEGSPAAGASPVMAQDLFWTQWAFTGPNGVAPGKKLRPAPKVARLSGNGARVAVFDTSPFDDQGLQKVNWITPTLNLCVWHPSPAVNLQLADKCAGDARDHGLFVSGLVHGVAPGSQIYLIRVLDRTARGDLFTLMQAMNLFIGQSLSETGSLQGTIINLSLGVGGPQDAAWPSEVRKGILDLLNTLSPGYTPPAKGRMPIVSLETLMGTLYKAGAITVAAAGNESAGSPGNPKDPQIPAAYGPPLVIGVAASNPDGKRACYSNKGYTAAPGGDGILPPCDPGLQQCSEDPDPANCPYGVISLVSTATSPTGYAYWAGSSFAAPLVSGSVAWLLGAGTAPGQVPGAMGVAASPGSEGLGGGVVKVP